MDYLYENLGDERFQEFCSCLISKEFPNMQSFPVGQPDGGRDSVVYNMNSNKKDYIIFQVKFVRNSDTDRDIYKWLTDTIKGESAKINKLIEKGAKCYYLITNVRGTAHLDTGTKDKVNKILEENIKIPSICWWRDDISRIFEKDPNFKWSFPEILNGQDILNSVLFTNLQEHKERRENVIKAYLTDQFEIDNEVKFKQIELQNRLLNLFIDVPLQIKKYNEKNKTHKETFCKLFSDNRNFVYEDDFIILDESEKMGAAEFFLHPKVQNNIERVLLEGGPGQGKSTISQYICQVHRLRLLNKSDDFELLPERIRNTPVRFPFKIDLRDIAAWVDKKNPYHGVFNEEYFNSNWRNSLEAFLIVHIYYHSKLEEFTSTDFIAICKLSHILFVFDGFDEIANIKVRGEVIDFINKGINRISANTKSLQVIITSRPAAFSDSVGFSIDNYPHFELTDITPTIINEYVEKWIKASKLDNRDSIELRKLMKDKLEMPHLKELAKSPMQLAIFISLLRTKGQSLPNKRTALYDSYIDLFFDRESEKNTLIRDKRDLIIDIHQYLAWLLHSEAELFKNNGRIQINELKTKLKEYLSFEGHDPSIADDLFDVMKERVCALVSRIQGTFEFEIQPLREYFCAKYLYKSAPHSSAGQVRTGSKPDRFHAILRNNYWQNVVRFFAGCADAGELDMIIHELKELQNDELLKYTIYPLIITSQLLSDFVFTQKPLKLKDVSLIILGVINNGEIMGQDSRFASMEPILLPNDCGRIDLVNECFLQLRKFPKNDYADELIGILNNNPLNNFEKWSEYVSTLKEVHLTKWLEYANKLKLIQRINEDQLLNFIKEGDSKQIKKRIQYVIDSNRIDIINKDFELKSLLFNGILNYEMNLYFETNVENSLYFLSYIFDPYILSRLNESENKETPFLIYINQETSRFSNSEVTFKTITQFKVNDKIDETLNELTNSLKIIYELPIKNFHNNIEPWDSLVESSRLLLKDNLILNIVAIYASSLKSIKESNDKYKNLNDKSLSLCKRIRYARLKSGNIKYWEFQLKNSNDLLLTLLCFFTWATPKTISQLLPILTEIIKPLDSTIFPLLIRGVSFTSHFSKFNKTQYNLIKNEMQSNNCIDEIKYIISFRFDIYKQKYIYENIEKSTDVLEEINKIKFIYLIRTYLNDPQKIKVLNQISEIYNSNNNNYSNKYEELYYFRYSMHDKILIPYKIAKSIIANNRNYPRIICSLAEKSCRLYANENHIAVGKIAKNEKWFDNS